MREEYTRTIEPARALSDLVNQACALTQAEIELLWKTALPRMPIAPGFHFSGMPECSQSLVPRSALWKALTPARNSAKLAC